MPPLVFDLQRADIRVRPAGGVILVDRGDQRFQPVGRPSLDVHRPAAFARPESRAQRVMRCGEKLQLIFPRRASGAADSAEDSRAPDAGDEHAAVPGVFRDERSNQFPPFRQNADIHDFEGRTFASAITTGKLARNIL